MAHSRPVRLLGMLALLCSGCGLAQYEASMSAQQERLDRLEKEDRELGEPLQMPELKEGWTDVYLRPPKGISPEVLNQTFGELRCYTRTSAGPIQNVYIDFLARRADREAHALKELSGTRNVLRTIRYTTQPMGKASPLEMLIRETSDGQYHCFVCTDSRGTVTIVYQLPEPAPNTTLAVIQSSLNTLALDSQASAQRGEYQRRKVRR
jgi:hypothetical protein